MQRQRYWLVRGAAILGPGAHAGSPADKARVAEYEAGLGELREFVIVRCLCRRVC
jgi:hypothetical protein